MPAQNRVPASGAEREIDQRCLEHASDQQIPVHKTHEREPTVPNGVEDVGLELFIGTFRFHFQLSGLDNLDCLLGFVSGALGHVLDGIDDFIAFEDFAKYDVTAVKPAKQQLALLPN